MDQPLSAYYTITASSIARERERLYEKARHDEAQALRHAAQKARQEGRQEGWSERNIEIAQNMKALGIPSDQIAQITGLTHTEIETL